MLGYAQAKAAQASTVQAQESVPQDVQDPVEIELAAQEAQVLEPEDPEVDLEPLTEEEEAELEEDSQEPPVEGTPEPPKEPRPPRRFEFALKASDLKAFVALLDHVTDEAKVIANKDGWHVRAVDPAHVALIETHVPDLIDCFERVCSTKSLERIDGDIAFGLDLPKMKEILRLAKKDDVVNLGVDLPDAEGKDRITVETGRTTRTMSAIDTEGMADPKLPALNLTARLTVAVADLLEAVRAAEDITDHVRLTVTESGLNVLGEGEVDKMSMDLPADVAYVQGDGGKATSMYPLDHLARFLKAVKAARIESLVVQLGTDLPIRVDWDGPVKGTWMCAPRIEADERPRSVSLFRVVNVGTFIEDLHGLLRKWGYPEWQVQDVLPRIVRVFEGVGILHRFESLYLVTELVDDKAAWSLVWELLAKEGIGEGHGPAT